MADSSLDPAATLRSALVERFRRSVAIIIGINQYGHGIEPLRHAVSDAQALAATVRDGHGYEVTLLCDAEAAKERIHQQFREDLPRTISYQDRLLVYFAGHGVAVTDAERPQGFLLPFDARPGSAESYLAMEELHDALVALPCRHLLLILDCCFAGSFRWSPVRRNITWSGPAMFSERYDRFVVDPAWQVITSAGADQPAFDALLLSDQRGQAGQHSPFAAALLAALAGAADTPPLDGLVTATELYVYLRNAIEPASSELQRQTPEIWQLSKHDKGEFLFQVGRDITLKNAPPLSLENNPYRGLEPFTELDEGHFHGRDGLIEKLLEMPHSPLTVLVGSSGSGKSSLTRAGLIPAWRRRHPELPVLGPMRPTATPLTAWQRLLAQHPEVASGSALCVIDQAEELFSLCLDPDERQAFMQSVLGAGMRLLFILRSDFVTYFKSLQLDDHAAVWHTMPALKQDELREIVEKPAADCVLYFEPSGLVDRLINDVLAMPGALPLLSFTLSELYRLRLQRPDERTLTEADYERLQGVAGALKLRASEECDALIAEDPAAEQTIRRVLLRMVAAGGQLARRRVTRAELEYGDPAEDWRVAQLLERLHRARLIVSDSAWNRRTTHSLAPGIV